MANRDQANPSYWISELGIQEIPSLSYEKDVAIHYPFEGGQIAMDLRLGLSGLEAIELN